MKNFNILNKSSGVNFGDYMARDEKHALEVLAQDAGYDSYAEMCEVAPDNGDLIVNPTMCVYCNSHIAHETNQTPKLDNDAAWAQIAESHALDCEWVTTRAHRR